MGYHPRIETSKLCSFITTRSRNSELWFINNNRLEHAILGYAAQFSARYRVKLYALAIEGNHIQGPAHFPEENRAGFMRDFNACVARAVSRHTPEYGGGRFWARRYSSEFLPGKEDIEEYFFYTVLQPIKDGLVQRLSDYPGYSCFHDAIHGVRRRFKVVRWGAYHAAKRFNPKVRISDFTEVVILRYARLPGYEGLAQKEYAKLMQEKFEKKRVAAVEERLKSGKGFAGRGLLLRTKRGSIPSSTKTSRFYDHRPRVLSICPKRRAECKAWYFKIYFDYKEASRQYRAGKIKVRFPVGTYKPYCNYLPPPESELAI